MVVYALFKKGEALKKTTPCYRIKMKMYR